MWHWSMPYSTLGYPRTQVFAWGAMHAGFVHGGAPAKSPFTSSPPDELTDMLTDPPGRALSPRFHSLPASSAVPSAGPDAAHPDGICGPTRQAGVHCQV